MPAGFRRHLVGKMGGNVSSAGWQVTLCDPMWHVSSRSDVATLRTAVHLLLTYLLTYLLKLREMFATVISLKYAFLAI